MPLITKEEYQAALQQRAHHTNHYVALLDELQYFETSNQWLFAYAVAVGIVYLCADPVTGTSMPSLLADLGLAHREFAAAWLEFAAFVESRAIVLVGMSDRMRTVAGNLLHLEMRKVGEEPWLRLPDYEPRGNACKGVRAGRNQARRAGCVVDEVNLLATGTAAAISLRLQVQKFVECWKATTMFHVDGLFMRSDVFAPLPGRRAFICRRGENLEALLIATPIVPGVSYYFEDVITTARCTNGAVELVMLSAIEALKVTGVTDVSLGTVALRKTRLTREGPSWLRRGLKRMLLSGINHMYNMNGIELSRKRFKPDRWAPVYVAIYAPRWQWLPFILRFALTCAGFVVALKPSYQAPVVRKWPFFSTKLATGLVLLLAVLGPCAQADTAVQPPHSYHLVGAVNTFIPGAGQFLLGNYTVAATESLIEVGTFAAGYSRSPTKPFTLDGVPESIPKYSFGQRQRGHRPLSASQVDIRETLWADWAQEVGIKYHMINVFDAYREAANANGGKTTIDQSSLNELFLAPYRPKNLLDPLTFTAILVSAAVVGIDYNQSLATTVTRTPDFTDLSDNLYGATYVGMYPIGSAAPEEMFFRGYVQNEMYYLWPTPYFSIPVTAALFGFSHMPEDRPSASVGGLMFGVLAHLSHNQLSRAIAVHYWVDVFTGLESYVLYLRAQRAERRNSRPRQHGNTPASPTKAAPSFKIFDFALLI